MLLGWIAGSMAVGDPAIAAHIPESATLHYVCGAAGALLVLAVGKVMARRGKDRLQAQ
jgi:hypothetical protein